PEAVRDEARRHASKLRESAATRRHEHRLALDAAEFVMLEDEAQAALAQRPRVELRAVEIENGAGGAEGAGADETPPPRVRLVSESNTTLRAELQRARADAPTEDDIGKPLRDRLKSWLGEGQRVR